MRALLGRLIRGLFRRIISRSVSRAASRALGRTVVRTAAREADNAVEDALDAGVNILELLELASEIPSIIDNARDHASSSAVAVFQASMGGFNPGQRALAEYAMEAADDYFSSTNDPDPDEYYNHVCSAHEAIEDALGATVEMSWEAGAAAGRGSIWGDIAAIIGEEVLANAVDIMGRKRNGNDGDFMFMLNSMTDWKYFEWDQFNIPRSVKQSPMYRPIKDTQDFLLPDAPDAPYWLKAQGMYDHAYIKGQISFDQAQEGRMHLYEATAYNPDSPYPPAGGYRPPFDIDVSGTQWDRPGYAATP